MDERARGLALRIHPLTETSLIVQWLTAEAGRLSTVARGARRPKSPFRGKLDLFYQADISFGRSRRSDLHTLREVSLINTHAALRRDITYLRQASYCAALIQQTTETETPLGPVYELMASFLELLPRRPAQPESVLAFEFKLLAQLGLKPDFDKSGLTAGAKQIAKGWIECGQGSFSVLKASTAQTKELQRFLHGFLIFHLGKLPRGRAAALAGESQMESRAGETP